jgi:hypothetical protein
MKIVAPTQLRPSFVRPWRLYSIDRAGLFFIAVLFGLLLMRALPIWEIGFVQDDCAASSWKYEGMASGETVFGFCHRFFKSMLIGQGRVVPVYCYLLQPLLVANADNLFVFRALQSTAQLVSIGAFAIFVAKLTRDWWAAGSSIIIAVLCHEIRDFHDSAYSQFITFPFLISLGSFAAYEALVCTESSSKRSRRALITIVVLNALAILTIDYAIPFSLVSCVLLVVTGNANWQTRLLRSCIAGTPVLITLSIDVILRNHYSSIYSGVAPGELTRVLPTYWGQLVSAMPLSYLAFDPQHMFVGRWFDTQKLLPTILLGAVACVGIFVATLRTQVQARGRTLAAAVVLLFCPGALIAFSAKYQQQTGPGLGYVQTIFSYLGFALLVVLIIDAISRFCREHRNIRATVLFAVSTSIGFCGAATWLESFRVADKLNEIWRYPRDLMEVWLQSAPDPSTSQDTYVINRGWLNRWETPSFLAQHTGKFTPIMTYGDAARKPESLAGRNAIFLKYPFRSHPTDLALVLSAVPAQSRPKAQVKAMVVSRDREKLAGAELRLLHGSTRWEIPPDIVLGAHGYYFRRLIIDVESVVLDEYRLASAFQ